ncbi:hypothetical protein AB4Y63_03530 [Leifsonia sp. YAF41]|uniref:hypothetical protein n=1 Tax=Leifsonia sp. YAF41 TaxID=3233086 RepID=UPI003F9496BA
MTAPDSDSVVYIAEFLDGPLEGQTDSRVLVRGAAEPRISMVAAVDGMESLFWYDKGDQRDVQGRLHVRYSFDPGDSDPVESNHEQD